MSETELPPPAAPPVRDRESPGGLWAGGGRVGQIVFGIAVAFSIFQIWTAAFTPLSSLVVRSIHVGFLLLLVFLLVRFRSTGEPGRGIPWYDMVLGGTGFVLGLYHWVFETDIYLRAGDPSDTDIAVGLVTILLVFEAARRIMGPILPVFCALFVPYALFGRSLPGDLMHRGYGLDQVIDILYLGTEGIYGTPTFVSSTFIFLFILFGAFLEQAGMIRLFNDVALGMVGHTKGGPAKVSVVASGMMATINGSGIANVLSTGQFTIPLMMRFGYKPTFAGAVEATASMGGQLMPPVMGAAAFIMSETIGVPFSDVALAAAIPAFLYFSSAFWMVHLEATKNGLVGLPKAECPDALAALRRGWHLLVPLGLLVYLLFGGYTPLFAGVMGLAATAVLILGTTLTATGLATILRYGFWIGLGLAFAALKQAGFAFEHVALTLIGALAIPSLLFQGGRATIGLIVRSMAQGARNALGVGIACALVGVLIGMLQLTGLAASFAGLVVRLADGDLFLALVLTMIACIILGMGVPTTANYIITSSIAAPALLEMGVPLMVSHMFVFYFGIMADLTPPVALAALAATSITRAGYLATGLWATRVGMAGYVVPFMAVYDPSLMLQAGTWTDTLYVVAKAMLAIGLWGAAVIGFALRPLGWPERVLATAGAVLLVIAQTWADAAGFVLALGFIGWQLHATRSSERVSA